MSTTLIVPGLNDRGRNWQGWLCATLDKASRLVMSQPGQPDLAIWTQALSRALDHLNAPCWLIARDFGALAALNLPAPASSRLLGMLLVAPAAPEHFGYPPDRVRNPGIPGAIIARPHDSALRLTSAAYLAERCGLRLYRPDHAEPEAQTAGEWPELLTLFLALQHTHQAMPRGGFTE